MQGARQTMKYYSVKTKCGHVGRTNCVWVDFAVCAENAKEAARKARQFGRAKHQHKDTIAQVKELCFEDFKELLEQNYSDPFLHCNSKREQNQIAEFDARVDVDEYNVNRRVQKRTKKESLEYRIKKAQIREKSIVQEVRGCLMNVVCA